MLDEIMDSVAQEIFDFGNVFVEIAIDFWNRSQWTILLTAASLSYFQIMIIIADLSK